MSKADDGCKPGDVILMGPHNDAGDIVAVHYSPDREPTHILVKPSEPEEAEVAVEHLAGPVYQVKSVAKGPAKVATNAYRTGWDAIFGKNPVVGQA